MLEIITTKKISRDEFESLNYTPTMEQFVRNRIVIRYENDSDIHNKWLNRILNQLDQMVIRIWYHEAVGQGFHRLYFLDADYGVAKDFLRQSFDAQNQKYS
jgi:ribosome-associated toxin RatA of RatAB toxin-antitoxin module